MEHPETHVPGHSRPSWHVARWLFLRALGATFLIAFLSLWVQIDGLFGSDGIAPIAEYLSFVHERLGGEAYARVPSLLWLASGDFALHALCCAGVLLSLALLFDVAPAVACFALWLLYLSVTAAGNPFLSFQWDVLLIEAGFLGILVAPWRILPRPSRDRAPPGMALFLVRWLLFRLMVLSGLVKLLSEDADGVSTWRELTAMQFHYWTQPLPGPLSRLAHKLPNWIHSAEVVAMLAVELAIPLLVFGPRLLQRIAFVPLVGLQVLIGATGNYGFFNLLTAALCLTLLDDAAWRRLAPKRLRDLGPFAADPERRLLTAQRVVLLPVGLVIALLGTLEGWQRVRGWDRTPDWINATLEHTSPFRTVNSYGLFAVMTTTRPEIVVEGSADGREWKAYGFRWKPGPLDRRPGVVQPHVPRLDWQMWFAALGSYRSPRNAWFLDFLQRLLEGSPAVLGLLEENPFPDAPPKYVRATVYDYEFAPAGEGLWWERDRLHAYCPVLMLENGELVRAR